MHNNKIFVLPLEAAFNEQLLKSNFFLAKDMAKINWNQMVPRGIWKILTCVWDGVKRDIYSFVQ